MVVVVVVMLMLLLDVGPVPAVSGPLCSAAGPEDLTWRGHDGDRGEGQWLLLLVVVLVVVVVVVVVVVMLMLLLDVGPVPAVSGPLYPAA